MTDIGHSWALKFGLARDLCVNGGWTKSRPNDLERTSGRTFAEEPP